MSDQRAPPSSWYEPSIHSTYMQISAGIVAKPAPVIAQPRLVSILDFLPLYEAFQAVEKPERGIELGLAIPAAAHGSAGFSALSSDTVWDAMVAMARFSRLRNAVFDYRCFKEGDAAFVEFRPRLEVGGLEKFFGYVTALSFYSILKVVSGDAAADGIRVAIPWRMPGGVQSPAGAAIPFEFEERFLGLRIPLDMAMRPSQSADPELCERLKKVSEQDLAQLTGSTAAKVRHLLHHRAPAWPSLQEVADNLGMSKRTAIRKLELENMSYQVLLDEVRTELACWFLRRPALQLSEIAEQVGFSDQASFTKSFQRVQGCTPSQYRADFRRTLNDIEI